MQKKKKKTKLFIFLIICFVLVPFLLTKGCNYMESLNQAENSLSEPISSISEQIEPSARVSTHAHTPAHTHSRPHNAGAYAHERAHTRVHNAHIYAQTHSISRANWTGTAVPNSGYVENVYINIDLTSEDIKQILDTIDWNSTINENEYYVFGSVESGDTLLIARGSDGTYTAMLINLISGNQYPIFSANNWSVGYFENPIVVNANVVDTYENLIVGNENDKLSALFSITPFEQSSNNNELSIGNLFTQLGNAIIIFGSAIVNVFISMEPIFWNEGPTLIFILLIASVSFGLVFWGIELLISLIGVFKTKRKKKK